MRHEESNMDKADILSMTKAELCDFILTLGEPKFRAAQIMEWLIRGADFSEMKNLPKTLREKLDKTAFIAGAAVSRRLVSADGTIKYLFELYDGEKIESVFMRYKHGNTLCISTEAGCPMAAPSAPPPCGDFPDGSFLLKCSHRL